jgi:hypothetical protein
VLGSYAGWAAPHATLGAAEEQQRVNWVKSEEMRPRYWGKVRAIQNCCAGAGIRALHQVWSSITTFEDGCLSVNMLLDKEIPQARVTSLIPFEGRLHIQTKQDCRVRFRLPDGVAPAEVKATAGGRAMDLKQENAFISAGDLSAGETMEVSMPLPRRTEDFTVGNAGFQQYGFTAEWKGDTVIRMTPDEDNTTTGMSHVMKERIPVYYGSDAPGRMYEREGFRETAPDVTPGRVALDAGRIDWYSLREMK